MKDYENLPPINIEKGKYMRRNLDDIKRLTKRI